MRSDGLRSSMGVIGAVLIVGVGLLSSGADAWSPFAGLYAQAPSTGQTPPPQATPPDPKAPPQGKPAPKGIQKNKEAFRSGVNLVTLSVTVTDEKGRYVTDLAPDDMVLLEDGVPQQLSFFESTRLPMALVMLVDTSASMTYKLPLAQDAAMNFVKRLRGEDTAQVVGFQTDLKILQEFTNDPIELQIAIQYLNPTGATSLYNAVYVAMKELQKLHARTSEEVRRRAIVILSDGEDTSSLIAFEEVIDLAKRAETAIYSVGMMSETPRNWEKAKEAEFVLRRLARETGGQVFFVLKTEEVSKAFTRIADELTNQYELGYVSNNPRMDGAYRQIAVRANRPSATARARPGYYAPLASDK